MTTRAKTIEAYLETINAELEAARLAGKQPKGELSEDDLYVCFADGVGTHRVAWYLLTGRWAGGDAPAEWVILDGGENEVARVHARTDYGALQAYSLGEGFAPYGPESDAGYDGDDELITPSRHPLTGRLWAPFTNYEITAERAADVDRFDPHSIRMLDGGDATFGRTDDGHEEIDS